MSNLLATIARLEPLIADAVQLLNQAVSSGAVQDFVSKVEDLAKQLEAAIAQHKAQSAQPSQ